MVTVGTDSHKRTHTFVAVDQAGREVSQLTVAATDDGHLKALVWAGQWPERRWALEGCRQLSRRLERALLASGETVVRVPPKLMAGARKSARTPGKSDPIDALAVARAVLREPSLPQAHLEGESRQLRLLVDHREDLVQERTRMQNRLRWIAITQLRLHQLSIDYVARRTLMGNSRTEAISALKRRLSDDVYRRLRRDEEVTSHMPVPNAA